QRAFSTFNAEARGFSVTSQTLHRNFVPHVGQGGVRYHETSWAAEAKYARDVNPSLHAEARLTYLHNDIDDFVSAITGDMKRIGGDLTYSGLRRNSILAGADYSVSGIDQAFHRSPPPPGVPGPPVLGLLAHDVHRDISGLLLQDRVDLNE